MQVQAGGGIVADSDPQAEVRETEAKAGAVMDAIRLACAQRTGHEGEPAVNQPGAAVARAPVL